MTSVPTTASSTGTPGDAVVRLGHGTRALAFACTILVIIALSILPLLTPWFIHPALDAAGSAARLGMSDGEAQAFSDRSVAELVAGPGTFAFDGLDGRAFYDASERSHLAEARALLWVVLIMAAISAAILGTLLARAPRSRRRALWRVIALAGATTASTVVVLGIVSLVAFSTLFTLFHQVFFPAGNWAFDPVTQRLVQLYPFGFWQIAAGTLGVIVIVFAVLTWLLGRALSHSPDATTRSRLGSDDA